MSAQKPREIAAEVLSRWARDLKPGGTSNTPKLSSIESEASIQAQELHGRFVEELLEAALSRSRLIPADRRLCQELVYGVVRWQAPLDWLIAQKLKSRTPSPGIQILLRLGLYQLFWLERIPDHAAVNETVELARKLGFSAQAGFVNALLRGYLRESAQTRKVLADLRTTDPHLGFSHPEWLVTRWQERWGKEKALTLMEWNNTAPKTFARINLLKTDPQKLLPQWRDEEVEYDFVRRDWLEENLVFELKSHPPFRELPSFQQGLFYIQDPSTLLPVRILDPRPGEAVLDLCAAPGGKLTYIAQSLQNHGRLTSHDISPVRLKLIEENCARLGVNCVDIVSAIPHSAFRTPHFDRVLIDAPCSNTGAMRRRVDLRWRIRQDEIRRLRGVQLELLRQGASLLKPGGILVYSTCSLEPEENRDVVQQFLREQNNFQLERERELLPFIDEVDGAYVARLRA